METIAGQLPVDAVPSAHGGRIAIFLPALSGGGAERVMVDLAGGLVQRRVPVDMVLGLVKGPYLAQLDKSVRIVPLNAVSALHKLWALSQYLRRERPAGLISALDNINLATMARALAGVPTRIVVGVHNNLSTDLASHRGLKGWLKPKLMRMSYRKADKLACVSAGVAADLMAATGVAQENVKVIYNPIRTDEISELSSQPAGHPWFDQPEVPVFLSAGRLTEQKDFPTLLSAFAQVRETQPVRLGILGEGPERDALKRLASELGIESDVAFLGFRANPYAFMARANVFVVSSAWEGLPTVLIEALACGTRVVSTDCPSGPREILADGRFGPLTKVGDPQSLARAMRQTLQTPCDRQLLRSRAADFNMDRAVRQYMDLFS